MKRNLLIGALAGVLAMGCGKEEEELPPPAASGGGASVTAVDPLAPPGTAPATATSAPEAFDPAKFGPPVVTTVDFSASDRPAGNDGNPVKDLEYLNEILWRFSESRASYSPEPVPQFKNDDERRAFDEAMRKLREPVTDLNELVRAKAIKAIPNAPAGKKYAINPKTLKVELVDASAQP